MKILIFLILFMVVQPVFAQSWVLMGEHKNIAYLINPTSDGKKAQVKNVILGGENDGYNAVSDWEIDCKKWTIRVINSRIFTPDNELISEQKEYGVLQKPEKGSFADIALRKYWCRVK